MKSTALPWYRVENTSADPSVAEIHIIDFIGGWMDDMVNRIFNEEIGITARAFVEDLAQLPASVNTLRVHINSPGGDVQAAVNIANALREQQAKGRTVETIVDGIAASAASIIMMAGSKVHMADNALVMIHNPWNIAMGNAAEMRKNADVLDAIRAQIIATYQWHSPLTPEALASLMDAETWMDADEALAQGFATDKVSGLSAAASIDARALAKLTVPEKFRARVHAFIKPSPTPPPTPAAATAAEVLRLCREGACVDQAEALITAGATLDQVQARIADVTTQQAAATVRASAITAACATARVPELAADYIAGAMSLETVKAQLVTIRARLDAVDIDNNHHPEGTPRRRAVANPNAMYVEPTH